jgi:hypothetical protein
MEFYPGVFITLSLILLSLVQWKRKSVKRFHLSERKEWLRTYFVLELNTNGEVANALWYHDPWLSHIDQTEFACQFMRWCWRELKLPLRGPVSETHYCTRMDYGNIDIFIGNGIVHVLLQDQLMVVGQWTWKSNNVYKFYCKRSWTVDQSVATRRWTSFHAFRTHLLETVTIFVKNKGFK